MFERVHLRSESFRCALLWHCFVEEVAVVDSPLLERLILWEIVVGEDFSKPVTVKIAAGVPNLRVLGYLETRFHQLQIGDNVIKVLPLYASQRIKLSSLYASQRLKLSNLSNEHGLFSMHSNGAAPCI
jgi:hypothetical protein